MPPLKVYGLASYMIKFDRPFTAQFKNYFFLFYFFTRNKKIVVVFCYNYGKNKLQNFRAINKAESAGKS